MSSEFHQHLFWLFDNMNSFSLILFPVSLSLIVSSGLIFHNFFKELSWTEFSYLIKVPFLLEFGETLETDYESRLFLSHSFSHSQLWRAAFFSFWTRTLCRIQDCFEGCRYFPSEWEGEQSAECFLKCVWVCVSVYPYRQMEVFPGNPLLFQQQSPVIPVLLRYWSALN